MKKIEGMMQRPIHPDEDASAQAKLEVPTFKRMMTREIGFSLGKDPENSIDMFQLGLKVRSANESLELEDAEFKLLKEKCEGNQAGYISFYHGQLMLKLREAEKAGANAGSPA